MAQAATKMLMAAAVLLLAASLWFPAAGQSGCTTALISLAPCLNYISGNSTIPSSTCCSQLGGVVQSEPQCLCTVLNGGASSLGISINQTQALALPSACKVQTPPVSQCKSGAGGTASSPPQSPKATPNTPATPSDSAPPAASSETPSSSSSPAAEGSPSGTGSKSTNGSPSSNSARRSDAFIVFSALIFAASCSSALL